MNKRHPGSWHDGSRVNDTAPLISVRRVEWNGAKHQEAVDLLRGEGKMIVTPTKVGYIIMVSDFTGLQRKFAAKQCAPNKPGVVLCSSLDQLQRAPTNSARRDW